MSDYNKTNVTIGGNVGTDVNTQLGEIETAVNSKGDKSGFTMTGDLDMNSNQVLNLLDAATASEPVTLRQLQAFGKSNTADPDGTFRSYNTMASAQADVSDLTIGDVIFLEERTANNGGASFWKVVDASTVTENEYDIVTGDGTKSLQIITGKEVSFAQLGIFDDAGVSDQKEGVQAAINLSLSKEVPLNGTYGTFRLDSALDKITENFTFYADQKGAFILLRNYTEADSTRGVLHAEAGTQVWENIYVHAAAGTSGGAGFSLVSTASTSPDYSKITGLLATGVSGGTFNNAYYFDGQARTGSAPGLRDIIAQGDAFASDVELVNATTINNARLDINCFAAGGSSSSAKISGISGNDSNNVYFVCSSLPDLKLDYLNNFYFASSSSMTSVTNTSDVEEAIVVAPFISSVQYSWSNGKYISSNVNTNTSGAMQIWDTPNGSATNNFELSYNATTGAAYIGPQASGNTELEFKTTTSGTYRATHKINSAGSLIFNLTQTAASAPNSSLFVDSADNKLKYKDSGGTTNLLY